MKTIAITALVLFYGIPWAYAIIMYLIGYFGSQSKRGFFQRKWHGAHDVVRIILAPLVTFQIAYLVWLRRHELIRKWRTARG